MEEKGMKKILFTNQKTCTGCRSCELACSFYHYNENNPSRALLHIVKNDEKSLDIPVICRHCAKAPCMEACPVKAIFRDKTTDAVKISREKCIGCKVCIPACPFGIIVVDPVTQEVRKCDLCDGNPSCARVCPTSAIIFERPDVAPRILARSLAEKKKVASKS
jgi:anaerobic carbon-monoxide dehydrogenase iron sulfur subunit